MRVAPSVAGTTLALVAAPAALALAANASAVRGSGVSGSAGALLAAGGTAAEGTAHEPALWSTFNGDLAATKYSGADAITPANVARLEKARELHTGDVADGNGELPKTVWSATPLCVNDTPYVGTPLYRILALEPDTGRVRWSYDPETVLEALLVEALAGPERRLAAEAVQTRQRANSSLMLAVSSSKSLVSRTERPGVTARAKVSRPRAAAVVYDSASVGAT